MTVLNTRHYLELIKIKVVGNLKAESSRDYLSYLWWVIEPALQMLAYYFVFGVLMRRGTENYVAFLLTGLIPWLWFNRCVNRSTMSIISGKALMMQVYIPKIILPTIVVCQDCIKQIVIFFLLFVFLYWYGISPSQYWLAIPLIILTQFFVVTAASFFVAAIVPFMNDLRFVVSTGLQLMFFCTGVFFDIEAISPHLKKWLFVNPMASILLSYRQTLISHQWPDWYGLSLILFAAIVGIVLMWQIIKRLDHIYPRVVL